MEFLIILMLMGLLFITSRELSNVNKQLLTYKNTESALSKKLGADKLIQGIKSHFNMYNTLKDIPFIVWWLKDSNSNLIECSNNLTQIINELSEEELKRFKENCKTSDRYVLGNYNIDGTRRAMAFYEVLELENNSKLWKVVKVCIPINETDNSKVNIFSIAIMHDKLHGSFDKARNRLKVLEQQDMVIKITDTVYINKSKGDY